MADYDLQYQDTHIDALLATANELKTAGYIYKGVATPSTNPGTPTDRVAYLASEPGTYTNFGGIVIASGLYSLTYASGTWTGTQMSAGSDIEVVQTTGQSTSNVMSQTAVIDSIEVRSNVTIINTGSCVRHAVMKADGSIQTDVIDGYFISNYISIPDGADTITYESVTSYSANYSYGCLFDSSNNLVLRFQGSGKIVLSEYPTAKSVVLGIPPNITTSPHIDILTHVSIENACVIDDRVVTSKTSADCTTSGFISAADGHVISPTSSQGYYISPYIDLSEYNSVKYSLWNQSASGNFIGGALYRADKSPLLKLYGDNVIDLADYPAAKYLVLAIHPKSGIPYAELIKGSRRLVKKEAENLAERVEDCEEELMYEKASGSQTAGNVDTSVATNALSSYYAMGVADSNAEHDGTINQVSFCAQTTGTIYFMLGVWDETHEYFSIRTTHTYSVTSTGNQTLLVSMPILKGETLMVNVSSGVKIKQKDYSSSTPPTGSKNAIISVDGGQIYHKYGSLRTYLSWTITWEFEQTLKEKVTENANDIKAVGNECERIGQQVSELANSKLLIQGNDGKVYRLIVTDGVLGIENTTPQNILILAHSFACILTGAWQRGMSSSKIATDWVSQINSVFLADDVTRFNMVSWEQAFPNPSSQLSSLNSYLTTSVDAIFIMCGANVPASYRTQQYGQTNYAELVNYCKARATNADIYVCSPGYTPETDGFNIGIKAGAESAGATYISTYSTQADKLANFGDVVWDASNSAYTFVINSNGRVNHPNDIWHLYIANNILSALGYNTLDKYHDISYNTSVVHRGYTRWVAGGHCTFCTFGNSQPVVSITDANNNAVSFNIMDLSGVTWADTPPTIPKFAVHFDMPDSDVIITIE
jgi:hypothetical protein